MVIVLLCLIIGEPARHRGATDEALHAQDVRIEAQVVELRRQQGQLKQEQHDRCVSGNLGRRAPQGILDQAANPPPPTGAAALDFTKIPHWDDLDVNTRRYLRSLGEALAAQTDGSNSIKVIADDYRKTNPQVRCVKPGGS
jgi:hypothetical protein